MSPMYLYPNVLHKKLPCTKLSTYRTENLTTSVKLFCKMIEKPNYCSNYSPVEKVSSFPCLGQS